LEIDDVCACLKAGDVAAVLLARIDLSERGIKEINTLYRFCPQGEPHLNMANNEIE